MKNEMKNLAKTAKYKVTKHSPALLTGMGITGMTVAGVLAVKNTPKAMRIIAQEEDKMNRDLSKKEKVKCAWKCYLPSVAIAVTSAGCLIGALNVNNRRNAAAVTAYQLTQSAFKEYKNKVVEEIGAETEEKITKAVKQDKINKHTIEQSEIYDTGRGSDLCYDGLSGRYFKTSANDIKAAENAINHKLMTDMYVSLNELYYQLGLEPIYPLGSNLGWNVEKGLIEIHITSLLSLNNIPCLAIDIQDAPYPIP